MRSTASLLAASAAGLLLAATPGNAQPTAELHVVDEDHPRVFVERTGAPLPQGKVFFKLQQPGKVRFELRDSNSNLSWTFDNTSGGQQFAIDAPGPNWPGNEFLLTRSGNLTIRGVLSEGSSRETKRNFRELDSRAILEKVVNLPVLEWEYKRDAPGTKHVGPVAEDWHETFGLSDGKSIASADAQGVALIAIQGLHEALEQKDDEISNLREENRQFAERLAALEQQISTQSK